MKQNSLRSQNIPPLRTVESYSPDRKAVLKDTPLAGDRSMTVKPWLDLSAELVLNPSFDFRESVDVRLMQGVNLATPLLWTRAASA